MNKEAEMSLRVSYTASTNTWGTAQASKYIEKTANKPSNSLSNKVDQIHITDPKLKEVLKVCNLSFDTISSWFSSSIDDKAALSIEGDTAYIKVKNHFHRDWISQKFKEPLMKAIQKCYSKEVKQLKIYTTAETREAEEEEEE